MQCNAMEYNTYKIYVVIMIHMYRCCRQICICRVVNVIQPWSLCFNPGINVYNRSQSISIMVCLQVKKGRLYRCQKKVTFSFLYEFCNLSFVHVYFLLFIHLYSLLTSLHTSFYSARPSSSSIHSLIQLSWA